VKHLAEHLWLLAYDPDLTTEARVKKARTLWEKHGYAAVVSAGSVSAMLLEQLAGSEAREHFTPARPPAEVMALLGDDAPAAAEETWNIIGGALLNHLDAVRDPFLPSQFEHLSDQHRGDAVFLSLWWGMRAIATLAKHDPDTFVARMQKVRSEVMGQQS